MISITALRLVLLLIIILIQTIVLIYSNNNDNNNDDDNNDNDNNINNKRDLTTHEPLDLMKLRPTRLARDMSEFWIPEVKTMRRRSTGQQSGMESGRDLSDNQFIVQHALYAKAETLAH